MPVKVTLLFAVTTAPADVSAASAHSGGWSESFHLPSDGFQDAAFFANWAAKRANLLSGLCSIIGYRQQLVTISGNKILPGGSGAGSMQIPGAYPGDLNAPQDALMLNFQLAGLPQTLRHRLPGIPDSMVTNGEYQPSAAYKGAVTNYCGLISLGAFSAIVRDLTRPDCRVVSLNGPTLITQTATGAIAGQYVRFRRVIDNFNVPVEGAFLVASVVGNADGTTTYTLIDPPGQTVSHPNGTVRLDLLVSVNITAGNPNRLVVRKVGRPFAQYRGRRSKRRL